MRRVLLLLSLANAVVSLPRVLPAGEDEKVIRLGMIGLDTSQVTAFMSAADESKAQGGAAISISEMIKKAQGEQ